MTAPTDPAPGVPTAPAGTMTIRRPEFDFSDLPERWVAGSRLGTWFGNAGHVFIPVGEQFFIDTVRRFRDVAGEEQRRDINTFIGQEAVHQRAHEQLWSLLEERGVPVAAYRSFIDRVRSAERFVPPVVCLSVTAALEHYTAAFGATFLSEDLTGVVPPEMVRMLAWHGLEELEHRSVAFDVLQSVDDSYLVRVGGFAIATAMLLGVPAVGVAMFARADAGAVAESDAGAGADGGAVAESGAESDAVAARDLYRLSARFLRRAGGHLVDYLRPGFHPRHMVVPEQAAAWSEALA